MPTLETFIGEDTHVTVEFEYSAFVPGRFTGPPENCYPDEGGECEIVSVKLGLHDITEYLSEADLELLLERCYDAIPDMEADAGVEYEIDRWEQKQLDKGYDYDKGEWQ